MAQGTARQEPKMSKKEKQFLETLKNIFIGVPIEGESGYINLMNMKARYYDRVIVPCLKKKIEDALQPFPNFREELFDKLYTFFRRYFTESGSLGFVFTPYHQSIYERVYTDEQDVILFWKTARFYYVKSDRLYKSMTVELDGYQFEFDVSQLEHKKANEKRSLVFDFKECKDDNTLVFTVTYSEKGRQTKFDEIRKAIKKSNRSVPSEETLRKAFQLFERQSEVDYFICKDAKAFLREQFDLWMWQYLLGMPGEVSDTKWQPGRIAQLQALKRIAYRLIDLIARFEDELVKIWNKPKFVLRSNYVITLDRIYARRPELLERILQHKGFAEQLKEWRKLGMVDESFSGESLFENNLVDGRKLNPRYQFLPLDTRYFKDLELEILSLFDNLDEALDGWLIKSENYQALNTILPKFRERVQTIYIDPPFNKESDADYLYTVKYKDSTWATLLENRIRIAKEILNEQGSIFVRCDYNGNWIVRPLMDEIFSSDNFRNELIINRTRAKQEVEKQFAQQTESLFLYSKSNQMYLTIVEREKTPEWHPLLHFPREDTKPRVVLGTEYYPPKGRRWALSQERIDKFEKRGNIRINHSIEYIDCRDIKVKGMPELLYDFEIVGNEWLDIAGYSQVHKFPTENSEILLKRVIESTSDAGNLVMDFFLGSGTTTAVAHKLGRKWIGVEMGEHFYTVVLPRMKRVLFYDKSGISKEKDVQERYNAQKAGGFFKYYELEQYEDTLRKARYLDDDLFTPPTNEDPLQYLFLRDLKMLDALEVDMENGTVQVDLSKLYPDIDLAETLSSLMGKWIRRITQDEVEFEDGTKVNLKNPDWKLIKPLIWW